jgi:phosphomannomutase
VLFAHEEAIGFMLGAIEKDKDGVSAAVAAAELAADVYARGQTLAQHWEALRQWYGSYEYRSGHCWADPPSKSAAVFERLRAQVPQSIGGSPVLGVRDLGTGVDTAQPGGEGVMRPADRQESGDWTVVRNPHIVPAC